MEDRGFLENAMRKLGKPAETLSNSASSEALRDPEGTSPGVSLLGDELRGKLLELLEKRSPAPLVWRSSGIRRGP